MADTGNLKHFSRYVAPRTQRGGPTHPGCDYYHEQFGWHPQHFDDPQVAAAGAVSSAAARSPQIINYYYAGVYGGPS